jgi:hypothetical protein
LALQFLESQEGEFASHQLKRCSNQHSQEVSQNIAAYNAHLKSLKPIPNPTSLLGDSNLKDKPPCRQEFQQFRQSFQIQNHFLQLSSKMVVFSFLQTARFPRYWQYCKVHV